MQGQAFKQGLKDAFTLLETLAPEATILGGQSAQAAISGTPASVKLSKSLENLQKESSIADAVLMSLRAAIQPASQSVLRAAADLAVSIATDDEKQVDEALARSAGSAMGALLSAAIIAGSITDELREAMKAVDDRFPAVAEAIVRRTVAAGIDLNATKKGRSAGDFQSHVLLWASDWSQPFSDRLAAWEQL